MLPFTTLYDFIHNLHKVHVWSFEKQTRVIFDFVKRKRSFDPFDFNVKRLFSTQYNLEQCTKELSIIYPGLHIIFVDKKIDNYMNGPRITITPSYIGILQYYITYFKPTTQNLIVLIVTKNGSKFYTLSQRSSLCYTVTYASNFTEEMFKPNNSFKTKTDIFYIYEKGMYQPFTFNSSSNNCLQLQNNKINHFEISNLEEIMFYGGAIYALQNSRTTLTSPYVTIDPLFNPEENNVEGLSIISHKTSTCFYEIEAFFHEALKSINSNLFYGDLIAIILKCQENVHIYFFVRVKNKFLFKFDITISAYAAIDAKLLHFADLIVSENPELSKTVSINFFKWDKTSGVNTFLKDMKDENLLIYNTPNYSETISKAKNNNIFKKVIFEKISTTVEFELDKCRICLDNDQYIAFEGEEWIPMYISFSQTLPIFGNEAIKDLEKSQESVIYDFIKLIGATSKTITFDPKWKFELIEMDETNDPKIGFKVKTPASYKIISPEMALTIYLQKLINIYEKHIGKSVDEIRVSITALTGIQKDAFVNAAKRLKKSADFC